MKVLERFSKIYEDVELEELVLLKIYTSVYHIYYLI